MLVYNKIQKTPVRSPYSGVGLTGPEEISYAIVPHSGDWREASIYEESCAWNEPLICTTGTHLEMSEASFIDVSGTGYEISAAYVTDRGIVLRLFNASGDGGSTAAKRQSDSDSPSRLSRKLPRTAIPQETPSRYGLSGQPQGPLLEWKSRYRLSASGHG